jgi:hypothetical protein
MSKNRHCTACGEATTEIIVIAGLRLPYHDKCAAAARRELRAVRDRISDALAERIVQRCTCDGSLPRADEI